MTEPDGSQPSAADARGATTWMMALRWPVAMVITATILATSLGRLLQQPIRIQLVMDAPLAVAGNVSVDSIKAPLIVERIETPIRTAPIHTAPISAYVTVKEGVRLASPLSVTVPELDRALAVNIKGPVHADVGGSVSAQIAGDVDARVAGNVSAAVRGSVDANVDGTIDTTISHPIELRRVKIGLW